MMASNTRDGNSIKTMSFHNNVADEWKKWKQRFEINIIATGKEKEEERVKIAILLNAIGDEGIAIYNTFVIKDEANITLNKIIDEFDKHCAPIKNTTMETFKFNNLIQKSGQSIENYNNELCTQAKLCEFACECKKSYQNRMIKDRLVVSVLDKVCREKFLREPNLTLEEMLEFCKIVEEGKNYIKILDGEENKTVNAINHKVKKEDNCLTKENVINCGRCGKQHQKKKCPAYGLSCAYCGRRGHFAAKCLFNKSGSKSDKIHNTQRVEVAEPVEQCFKIGSIQQIGNVTKAVGNFNI